MRMVAVYDRILGSSITSTGQKFLRRVAIQAKECSLSIRDYCNRSFSKSHSNCSHHSLITSVVGRMIQNIVSPGIRSSVEDYCKAFDDIEKDFEKGAFDETNMLVTRILDAVEEDRKFIHSACHLPGEHVH